MERTTTPTLTASGYPAFPYVEVFTAVGEGVVSLSFIEGADAALVVDVYHAAYEAALEADVITVRVRFAEGMLTTVKSPTLDAF